MPDGGNISGLINRRDALKLIGVGVASGLLGPGSAHASGGEGGGSSMAMLYDATKCVGCRSCEEACSANHGLSSSDGVCDPLSEDCECPDCLGTLECVCTTGDLVCDSYEYCICPDCWADASCSDPEDCEDDGECGWSWEGCHCADCAAYSFCADYPY